MGLHPQFIYQSGIDILVLSGRLIEIIDLAPVEPTLIGGFSVLIPAHKPGFGIGGAFVYLFFGGV